MPVDDKDLPPMAPNVAAWTRDWTPGPLTADELHQFYEHGYFIKHNLIPPSILEPVIAAVSDQVDALANELYAAKKITNLHADAPFTRRLIELEKEFPPLSVLMHKRGQLAKAYQDLWVCEPLLSCAKQIVGPDIGGHPVWNLRTKTPGKEETVVPWHQDAAYLTAESVDTLQLTAWIPLVDATLENGCMQLIHGGHRAGKCVAHNGCSGNTWYIETDTSKIPELNVDVNRDIVTCEVPFGSVLFLQNLIPHRSVTNRSNGVRWSLDLRWQKPDLPNGFYSLKETIVMGKADDPSYTVDWDAWSYKSRQSVYETKEGSEEAEASAAPRSGVIPGPASPIVQTDPNEDPFDSIIVGPWMDRWPLTHRNHHTDKWEKLMTNSPLSPEERKQQWTKA